MKRKNKIIFNLQLLASNDKIENEKNKTDIEKQLIDLQNQVIQLNDLKEKNKQLEELNQQLFTKNQEYFLKITNNISDEPQNKQDDEIVDFVGKEFFEQLSTKERKQLKIILEGED